MISSNRIVSAMLMIALLFSLISIAVTSIPQPAEAAGMNYYVSMGGSDTTGNGTQGNPWKTINKALTTVAANQDHTVNVAAGTYNEGKLTIPSGVNLIGAGSGSTTIDSTFFNNCSHPCGFNYNWFAVNASGNQTIKGFKLDGNNGEVWGGVLAQNVSDVIIDDIRVDTVYFTGIWLDIVSDSEVKNSTVIDSGISSYAWGIGNIVYDETTNVDIHDNTISTYPVSTGKKAGYAQGSGFQAIGSGGSGAWITNTRFYNNDVDIDLRGGWLGGGAPGITLELNLRGADNVEIYNNVFNNLVSLPSSTIGEELPANSIHFHHNTMIMREESGYCFELDTDNIEIDHNYCANGNYPLVNWGNYANPEYGTHNYKIHHNVFENNKTNLMRFEGGGATNLQFYNNTVYTDEDEVEIIYFNNANDNMENDGIYIKNNIFYTTNSTAVAKQNSGTSVADLVVQYNAMYNYTNGTVSGTFSNNLTNTDPELTLSGNKPDPYYVPLEGSPVIDAGVDVGFSYLGSAPDMGAYEYDSGSTPPADIIIDNLDAGYDDNGTIWSTSSNQVGYYGTNYRYDTTTGADSSSDYAIFTPDIETAGNYNVYIWWVQLSDRPDAAPLEIAYSGGTDTTKTINQKTNGGQWNLIGTYNLSAGTSNYVKILATDAGKTIADAVKFEWASQ